MDTTSNARRLLAETDLVQGLGIQEVETRLQVGLRLHDARHRILAFYLADMDARGLHQERGFSTLVHYARERLGLSKRRAYELLRAGQKLLELPSIDRAFAEQRIGWSKVQLLVKVATPEHEEAWLERALALTVRELEREIARSKEGQAPRKPGDQRGLSHIKFSIGAKVSPLTHRKWDRAKAKLSAELGHPLSDAEVLDLMAEMCLGTDADGTIPGRKAVHGSLV
jgi:hypothetical protein